MIKFTIFSILIIQSLVIYGQEEVIVKLDKDEIQKSDIFIQADTMPDLICDYKGDYMTKIKTFIGNNLQWPITDVDIAGTIYVQFIVEKDSTISNINILRRFDPCSKFDDEAIRVVKLMVKWKPGIKDGQLVRVQLIVPVKFILE